MKVFLTVVFACLVSCCFGQTEADMNRDAYASFQKADQELNQIYRQILTIYKADTAFVHNLQEAQRIWVKLRDAERKALYPEREPGYYGSLHPVCRAAYLETLTRERIEKLRRWLNGAEEGDACAGSIRVKP